ncbi:tetratricopeptide repeat protein [Nocardiopsis sp. CC223A]|uniref:tetratricopeptide repeat protein n=1 Tax=Nocardiopsis sp. CC223A TaxID=3044051 RepID=UPI00278BE9BA|nr:tetratricopeptide repeat protein [Nocardiopsis sp. CC223A]
MWSVLPLRATALLGTIMGMHRCGFPWPLRRAAVEELHTHFLPEDTGPGADDGTRPRDPEPLSEAWAWLAAPRPGVPRLFLTADTVTAMDPEPPRGYTEPVPDAEFQVCLGCSSREEALHIARTRLADGAWRQAESAYRRVRRLRGRARRDERRAGFAPHRARLQDRARELARTSGPDAPETLAAREELAALLWEHRRESAVPEYRSVWQGRSRTLGPDHPDTLAARQSLALTLRALARPEEAGAEIGEVLRDRRRVQGADHPDTLKAWELACRVDEDLMRRGVRDRGTGPGTMPDREPGRLADLESELLSLVAASCRVLGPDHPDTLARRWELGRMPRWRGAEAESAFELAPVVETAGRVLGEGHRQVRRFHREWTAGLRDVAARHPEHRTAVADLVRDLVQRLGGALGEDHPHTLMMRTELLRALRWDPVRQEAELTEALGAHRRALEAADPPPVPPDTDEAEVMVRRLEACRAAASETVRALTAADRLPGRGPGDQERLNLLFTAAWTLSEMGVHDEAVLGLRAIVRGYLLRHGDRDPDTWRIWQALVVTLVRAGGRENLEGAATELGDLVSAQTRALGADHSETLRVRSRMAATWVRLGLLEEAEAEYRAVLAALRRVVGPDARETLDVEQQLAEVIGSIEEQAEREDTPP